MDWIVLNLIINKRTNKVIYGVLFGIIILDFLNDQIAFVNEKYLIIDFSIFAITLLVIKEMLSYWYRNLYRKNQLILDSISDLSKSGNYIKIREQVLKIKTIKPQVTEKIYWTGFANVYLNNPQKALEDFDSIESEEYANFGGFFYHKGLALIDTGNTGEAIEYLTRSIELETTWQNLDQRGVAYMNLDKFEESEKDLKESIKLKEDSSNTTNLGILLDKKGQHKEALKFYNRSIEIEANNPNAFYNRALANYSLGNYQDSIADNTKTIKYDSERHSAFYNRALSRQKINELESAIEDFNSAEKLDNNNNYLYMNRGFCKCKSSNISNGLNDLKKALDLDCKEAEELIEKYDKQ